MPRNSQLIPDEVAQIDYDVIAQELELLTPGRSGASSKELLLEPLKGALMRCRSRGVPYNKIAELLGKYGIKVAHQTVRDIVMKWEEQEKQNAITLSEEIAAKKHLASSTPITQATLNGVRR